MGMQVAVNWGVTFGIYAGGFVRVTFAGFNLKAAKSSTAFQCRGPSVRHSHQSRLALARHFDITSLGLSLGAKGATGSESRATVARFDSKIASLLDLAFVFCS